MIRTSIVRIIEGGQGVEGLFDHLRRLVVARHVNRDFRSIVRIAHHRQEFAPTLVNPHRFGQFMGLGQQHDKHPERTERQEESHRQTEPGAVLLAVVVTDPHQHRTAEERDKGQEGTATLTQGRAVDHQQGQRQQRQHHRTDGQHAPLRDRHHRAFEVEFLLTRGVEHAPVGAHRTFVAGLPRLVERFDHEVVEALAVELVDQRAQVDRLIRRRRIGATAHATVARPADLGQQQRFFREHLFQVAGAVEDELPGLVHGNEFPVRQNVRGDQVDVLGQFRVFFPDVPLLGGGHRHFHGRAHAIKQHAQFLGGDFLTEDRFVADHHANHAARGVGQFDGASDFPFVAFLVRADPDPQRHAQAEFFRQFRDVSAASRRPSRCGCCPSACS